MKAGIALALALAGVANAWASSDYRCTIDRTESAAESQLNQMYIGKQFTVERQSGLMAGALKNSFFTDPVVVDQGSTENSFKVVTTMRRDQGAGGGSAIYALTIMEYHDTPRKPFIFLRDAEAFLGWCEHF